MWISPLWSTLTIVVLCLLAYISPSDATHFAYGSISWLRNGATGLKFDYSIEMAYRRSFFTNPTPSKGPPATSHGVGGMSWRRQSAPSTVVWSRTVSLTVQEVYPAPDDYYTGIYQVQLTLADSVPYQLYYTMCCRISTLVDGNKDKDATLIAIQNPAESASPRTSGLPRFYFEVNKPAYFRVTAQSPQGYPMTFTEPLTGESGLPVVRPVGSPGWTIAAGTGLATWTPIRTGLHAYQVRISDGRSSVPLDVIFSVLAQCSSSQCPRPPTFVPEIPVDQVFYRGVQRTVNIVATCLDTATTTTISNSPLPSGATMVFGTSTGPTSSYKFTWQPDLSQPSFVVCFQATESRNGLVSLGNYCVNMVIGTASLIYVSGIVRDFPKTGSATLTDFNRAIETQDAGVAFVSSSLQASGKPLFTGSPASTNAANFAKWWTTDPAGLYNKEIVLSTTLSNGTNANGQVFTFLTNQFYPIDNQGFGNEGDPHNKYYTYEIHTYLTYKGGELFNLQSSDDLWVFIDGKLPASWTMSGIHPTTTNQYTINMNDLSLVRGTTYRCDIFYACRSSVHECGLKLELSNGILCDAIQSGTVLFPGTQQFATGINGNINVLGRAAVTGGVLNIIPKAAQSDSGAAWWQDGTGVAQRIKLLHGFSTEFDFAVTAASSSGNPEGFALVFQAASVGSRGGESSNLGYSTIVNSVAIEFDMNPSPEQGDPTDTCVGGNGLGYQHISVHTRSTLPNSASETASIGKSICPATSQLTLSMHNASWHRVKVTYTPAKDDPSGGPQLGWIRVFMSIVDAAGTVLSTVIAPLAEAQVDGVILQSMWPGGAAYAGFTASTSDTNGATIGIKNWKMTIVPASPTQSTVTAQPVAIRAGQIGSVGVQLKDSCSNLIKTGGDGSSLASSLKKALGTSVTLTPSVTDLLTGVYTFSYAPTFTGLLALTITLNGQPILNSPFQVIVRSGVTVPEKSTAIYSPDIEVAYSNSPKQSAVYVVVVDEVYGDVISKTGYDVATEATALAAALNGVQAGRVVAVAFAGTVGALSSGITNALTGVGATGAGSVTVGGSYCSIQVKGAANAAFVSSANQDATPTITRDFASATIPFKVWCYSAGGSWGNYGNILVTPLTIRVAAGSLAKIFIEARDTYGNLNTDGGDPFSLTFSPEITTLAGGVVSDVQSVFDGYYMATFNCTIATKLAMFVKLASTNIGVGAASLDVYIDAGLAVASKSSLIGSGLVAATAGVPATFDMILYDQYGNQVLDDNHKDVLPSPVLTLVGSSTTTVTATCSWIGSNPPGKTRRCSYTANKSGTYSLAVSINGQSLNTAGIAPKVVAGVPAAAQSYCVGEGVTQLLQVPAGRTTQFWIQTADMFGNDRDVAIPTPTTTYQPQVTFGSMTGLTVFVGSSSPYAAVYDSAGRYLMKYQPTVATNLTITAFVGSAVTANRVGGTYQPMTIQVIPGAAGKDSTLTAPVTITACSGCTTNTLTLLSKDSYNNIRTRAPYDVGQYIITMKTTSGLDIRGVTSLAHSGVAGSGNYILTYAATKIGTYSMNVVTLGGSTITGSGATFQVIPAATDYTRCTVSGAGVGGGVASTTVTFIIQAMDQFDNPQSTSVADTWTVTIGSLTAIVGPNGGPGFDGQYLVTYQVPASGTYVLRVLRTTGGVSQQVYLGNILSVANAAVCYATLETPLPGQVANALSTFTIRNKLDTGSDKQGPVSNFFKVRIYNPVTGYVMPNPVVDLAINPTTALASTVTYVVSYTPRLAGSYLIEVSERGIAICGGAQPFTISPGAPDSTKSYILGLPTTSTAGVAARFYVVLVDASGTNSSSCAYTMAADISTDTVTTATCTCNAGTFMWSCLYTATQASGISPWDVSVRLNGNGLLTSTVTVIAAAASAATTTVPGLANTYVAGTAISADIIVKDAFGNAVTSAVTFVATNAALASAYSIVQKATGSNIWVLSFTPTLTQTSNLAITMGGTAILGSSFAVTIVPAAIDATATTIVAQVNATAGQPLSFTINAKDTYGNAWKSQAGAIRAVLNSPATNQAGVALTVYQNDAVAVTTSTQGQYLVSIAGSFTTVAGAYTWTLYADSALFTPTGLAKSYVRAGATDPRQTIVPGSLADSQVDIANTATIILCDQYGNQRYGATQETVTFKVQKTALQCIRTDETGNYIADGIPTPQEDATSLFSGSVGTTSIAYQQNGQYLLTYRGRTRGVYSLNITVTNTPLYCVKASILTFTMRAGLVSPQHSSYTRLGAGIAGNTYAIAVTLRDVYDNVLDAHVAGTSLTIGYTAGSTMTTQDTNFTGGVLPAPSSSNVWFANSSRRLVTGEGTTNQGVIIIGETSSRIEYTLTLQSFDAGNFIVGVLVTAPGVTRGYISCASCQSYWPVLPTLPSSFSTPAIGTPTAGKPESFVLQGTDQYGNPIVNTDHTYTVLFQKAGYQFEATVTPIGGGQHRVDYLSQWHGNFDVTVTLISSAGVRLVSTVSGPYYIKHATCEYEVDGSPYRCPNRTCVAAYSQCTEITSICADATPIRCAFDNSCIATTSTCPCPTGLTKCADGSCAATSSKCIPTSTCPSTAPTQCLTNGVFNGECRVSLADCPTPLVCTPGYVQCPSGTTCARTYAACDATIPSTDCSISGQYRCPSGQCVARTEDCATPKTCSTGKVLCSDGSCQTSATQCPDQYPCYAPASYRCYDGSCRQSFEQCPTPVTCPPGYLLCESGSCSKTLSACASSQTCSADQVRCPDGSCVNNIYFCPSSVTCLGSKPVRCSDGSCQSSVYFCPTPSPCGSSYTQCGDGTCITGTQTCPTTISCAATTPLLCPDGSCTANITLCTIPPSCPVSSPYRCPEGSCRGSSADCPSQTTCLSSTPIRCADGTCAVAADNCNEVVECSGGKVRCSGGECAYSAALCPTHVTCALGTSKCLDGTCRTSCAAAVVSTCPGQNITCPQATAGVQCAATLEQCPQGTVCPTAKPVKCLDGTCAAASSLCPPVPSSYPDNRVACADGRWAADISLCGTVATCPSTASFKCYDDTCRTAPTDCPTAPSCSGTTPYLCPNGVCAALPWSPTCGTAPVVCPDSSPVKCTTGQCVVSIDLCPSNEKIETSVTCSTVRCRDGSCVLNAATCLSVQCPASLPYVCDDGMCAANSTRCNNEVTGCPWDRPNKCRNGGNCVANLLTDCQGNPACPTGQVSCADGSCNSNAAECPASATGCANNQRLCLDKTCVARPSTGVNLCTVGSSTANTCPDTAPYRCSNGFCVTTSLMCPKLTNFNCSSAAPAQCADGSCRYSLDQCPTVKPCTESGYQRCGDGSCRLTGLCPTLSTCPATLPYRCTSGLCSTAATECIDVTTGCITGYISCSNGACIPSTSSCNAYSPVANGCPTATPVKCWDGACAATSAACRLLNGCPSSAGYRCTVDNACEANPATCVTSHTTPCSATAAICADGTCPAGGASACLALNGCPVTTPVRCGDGTCAINVASCPVVVVCDIAAGEVLCYDGSCVSSYTQCAPAAICSGATSYRCPDQTCASSASSCPSRTCPSASPVLCPSGVCKGSLAACPSSSSTGTVGGSGSGSGSTGSTTVSGSGTGTTTVDLTRPTCTYPTGYECFDGSCRESLLACSKWAAQVRGQSETAETTTICTNGTIMCSSGSCAADSWSCPVVPACSQVRPLRCWDGTCTNTTCTPVVTCGTSGTVRCEDGICRTKCLQFDGCPLGKPFHCGNRECAAALSGCAAAATFDESLALKRRLLQSSSSSSSSSTGSVSSSSGGSATSTPTICYSDCIAETKATSTEFVVDTTKQNSLAIAVDSSRIVQASLTISGGSMVKATGTPASSPIKVYIHAVGDSRMRDTVNKVTPTRQGTFGRYMAYSAALLSPAFECSVPDYIVQPFAVPITVQASIDMTRAPMYADVCLAYIYYIRSVNFAAWKCVDRSDTARLANPVRDTKSNFTDAYNVVQGTLRVCDVQAVKGTATITGTIYGFVHAPARAVDLGGGDPDTFWRDNLIWIVLGICAFGAVMAGIVYAAKRLHRYRNKYKTEADKVAKAQEEVDNMEQFGGQSGNKDEQLEMMSNPMVIQMQQMQAMLDRKNEQVLQEQQIDREAASEQRQDHITALQDDRNKLAEELERLKAELALSTRGAAPVATAMTVSTPSSTAGSGRTAAAKKPAVVRQEFDSKPAARKKKDVD